MVQKLPSRVHFFQYRYCFNCNTSNHFSGHAGIQKNALAHQIKINYKEYNFTHIWHNSKNLRMRVIIIPNIPQTRSQYIHNLHKLIYQVKHSNFNRDNLKYEKYRIILQYNSRDSVIDTGSETLTNGILK